MALNPNAKDQGTAGTDEQAWTGGVANSGGALAGHEGYRPNAKSFEKDADLYGVAFDESVRRLNHQVTELSAIRQRAVQFLAFVGSATAFLLGSSFDALVMAERTFMFSSTVIVGTLLAVAMLVSTLVLLRPGFTTMASTASAKDIIGNYIEREVPAANKGELLRDLAWWNDDDAAKNRVVLTRAHRIYNLVIGLGVVQLLVWIQLVWFQVSAGTSGS